MSYSHDDEEHKEWVLQLAYRLRGNGVDVCLDRWDVTLGGNLAHFMERTADKTYRVIAVVSATYTDKCNERSGGAGVEAQMMSARLYSELDSNAVIPIVRNNPRSEIPSFLSGRRWLDFQQSRTAEATYADLLRDIHGVPLDAAPPIGPNPFDGRTTAEAILSIRNSAERWHSPGFSGDVEFVASQNSGKYKIGSGDTQFTLDLDWLTNLVRAYNDPRDIAHVAVIERARERCDLLSDISQFELSNRVVYASTGDAFALHNCNGFWALVYIDKLYSREGPLNREEIIEFRYSIQKNRTPNFIEFAFPDSSA